MPGFDSIAFQVEQYYELRMTGVNKIDIPDDKRYQIWEAMCNEIDKGHTMKEAFKLFMEECKDEDLKSKLTAIDPNRKKFLGLF